MFAEFEEIAPSLLPFLVLNLPPDACIQIDEDPFADLGKSSWSIQLLDTLAAELGQDSRMATAYLPLVASSVTEATVMIDMKHAFQRKLSLSNFHMLLLLCKLVAYLMIGKMYDGRGRTFCVNIARSFHINLRHFLFIERKLYQYFTAHFEEISLLAAEENRKSKRSKYIRYAKIGVVSLGAGAVIAVTGGLAAPAIAAALVVMGSTSAAVTVAASATTVACVFGGTAAGLSGYKMMKRTRGVTEFAFEQYYGESMPSLMVVISGWQKRPEDYKRAAGVIPSEMTDKERLSRYYYAQCPERLAKVDNEIATFSQQTDGMASLFDQLQDLYSIDPRDDNALVPPPYVHPGSELMDANSEQFRELTAVKQALQAFLREFSRQACQQDDSKDEQDATLEHNASGGRDTNVPVTAAAEDDHDEDYSAESHSVEDEGGDEHRAGTNEISHTARLNEDAYAQLVQQQEAEEAAEQQQQQAEAQQQRRTSWLGGSDTTPVNTNDRHTNEQKQQQSSSNKARQSNFTSSSSPSSNGTVATTDNNSKEDHLSYWHWHMLPESTAYSLYLLRWETQLQLDLGGSIFAMLRSLGATAVQDVLSLTLLTSLAAAAFWPVLLLQLTSMIDNLWTIAVERADLAGQELAHALLQREQGARPVTLVGYSMGARVIFSCLRTLAKELQALDAADAEDALLAASTPKKEEDAQQRQWRARAGGGDAAYDRTAEPSPINNHNTSSATGTTMMQVSIPDADEDEFETIAEEEGVGEGLRRRKRASDPVAGAEVEREAEPQRHAAESIVRLPEEASTPASASTSSSSSSSSYFGAFRRKVGQLGQGAVSVVSSAASSAASSASSVVGKVASVATSSGEQTTTKGISPDQHEAARQARQQRRVHLQGLLEHVVLLGAPVSTTSAVWRIARQHIVAGRLVNGYSRQDLVLGLVYRYQRFQVASVAGVAPVRTTEGDNVEEPNRDGGTANTYGPATSHAHDQNGNDTDDDTSRGANTNDRKSNSQKNHTHSDARTVENAPLGGTDDKEAAVETGAREVVEEADIENFDLSDLIAQHTDYSLKLPQILRHIDLLRLRERSQTANDHQSHEQKGTKSMKKKRTEEEQPQRPPEASEERPAFETSYTSLRTI